MRRKKNPVGRLFGIIFLLVMLFVLAQKPWFWVIIASVTVIIIMWAMRQNKRLKEIRAYRERCLRAIEISNVDNMSGHEFEQYVRRLLIHRGFVVEETKKTGDLGVDLKVQRNGYVVAVQVKRHSKPVSRLAVSDAVAGIAHYGCNRAMVITNNYFTPGAKNLARSNGCELVDRDVLTRWIVNFQSVTR